MSQRSEEFLVEARERLAVARITFDSGFHGVSVSMAYYAMLYAARAALSEEDLYSKTHSGTWHLFGQTFVETGRFDRELAADARDVLPLRIGTDYEALRIDTEQADEIVQLAERFLNAVEALYPD